MVTWKETRKYIINDIKFHGGRSLMNKINVYFFSTSFRLLLNYRLGRFFSNHRFLKIYARYYRYVQITKRNCDISYNAIIGNDVKFLHPLGIVIGDQVIVDDHVRIWQNVTLGSHGRNSESISYPHIHAKAKIFAGVVIIGSVMIGENSTIGANSVVNIDVPPDSKAVGAPAKIIYK